MKQDVIKEIAEEYSDEEGDDRTNFDPATLEDVPWQELMEENEQLKDQILNQIAIFQQYLKVAVLQHKAR